MNFGLRIWNFGFSLTRNWILLDLRFSSLTTNLSEPLVVICAEPLKLFTGGAGAPQGRGSRNRSLTNDFLGHTAGEDARAPSEELECSGESH